MVEKSTLVTFIKGINTGAEIPSNLDELTFDNASSLIARAVNESLPSNKRSDLNAKAQELLSEVFPEHSHG